MDMKRISGLAIDSDGNTVNVSIIVPERSSEIIESVDMEIELRMSCAARGLRLAQVTEIDYVGEDSGQ